jgi:hypothetical protein
MLGALASAATANLRSLNSHVVGILDAQSAGHVKRPHFLARHFTAGPCNSNRPLRLGASGISAFAFQVCQCIKQSTRVCLHLIVSALACT